MNCIKRRFYQQVKLLKLCGGVILKKKLEVWSANLTGAQRDNLIKTAPPSYYPEGGYLIVLWIRKMNVINGNCLDVLKKMGDNSFDYGFTSPPYNRLRNDKYQEYVDKIDDYYLFLCNFTDELLRICKDSFFVNVQKTMYNKVEVLKYLGNYASQIKEIFIWEKTNPMPAAGYSVTNAYEFFIYFGKNPPKSKHTYTKNVFSSGVNSEMPKEHKAVMKQSVADFFIGNFFVGGGGQTCIDPFFGLGTTAIACDKNKIQCTGIELSSVYCELAKKKV